MPLVIGRLSVLHAYGPWIKFCYRQIINNMPIVMSIMMFNYALCTIGVLACAVEAAIDTCRYRVPCCDLCFISPVTFNVTSSVVG